MKKSDLHEIIVQNRSKLFSLSLLAALVVLFTLRDIGVAWYGYWIAAGVLYSSMIIEVLTAFSFAKRRAQRMSLVHIPENTLRPNFYYHIILPSLLYISTTTFLFFDFNTVIDLIIIGLSSATYYIFLLNVRAAYLNDFKTESWSQQILDSTTVVIYFSATTTLVEVAERFAWNSFGPVAAAGILFIGFLFLTLWKRQEVRFIAVLGVVILGGLISLAAYLTWVNPGLAVEPLRVGFLWTIGYYLFSATFLHKLEGTLNPGIFLEYLLIAAVAIFVI